MTLYVIGDYGDGYHTILGEYDSVANARGAIHWQGTGAACCDWHDDEKATVTSFARNVYETTFYICEPTKTRGQFKTITQGNLIDVTGTCLIAKAHNAQLDRAVEVALINEIKQGKGIKQ